MQKSPLILACALAVVAGSAANAAGVRTQPLPAVLDIRSVRIAADATTHVEIRRGTLAPGAVTIWHIHDTPPFVYVVSGTGTWECKGRAAVTRHAGQAIMEPAGIPMRVVNRGTAPLELVIFQALNPGQPALRPAP